METGRFRGGNGIQGWKRVGLGKCYVGVVGSRVGAHCNISVLTWLFLKNCPLNIKCNILDTNHNLYVKPNLLAAAV